MTDCFWNPLQDVDRYLYHYTRAETLTKYILPNGTLRFNRFKCVNDPRETKDWSFAFASARSRNFDQNEFQKKLNERLKHRWRVCCFVTDAEDALFNKHWEHQGRDILSAISERGHSRPRMWAQYGEQYAGACLVFDKQKLTSTIRSMTDNAKLTSYKAQVEYRNPRFRRFDEANALTISLEALANSGFNSYAAAHAKKHWKELFFKKSKDWEQEREYRWVIEDDREGDLFVKIGNSMVGMLLGDKFPEDGKPAVGEFALENSVSVAELEWQNGVPQIHPTHSRILANSG